jgi:hypothetical protein
MRCFWGAANSQGYPKIIIKLHEIEGLRGQEKRYMRLRNLEQRFGKYFVHSSGQKFI